MMLTAWQVKQRMSLPLEAKVVLSQSRIRDWYEHHDGMVYVAFSGGRDSTVLLDLVRSMYPNVPGVFNDTGLEYPEIREFVATFDNIEWLHPKKGFPQVIREYGYPIISKEQAQFLRELRHTRSKNVRDKRINGNKWGRGKVSKKWLFLRSAPFEISEQCCFWLKKRQAKIYEKRTGREPYLGMRATEGSCRTIEYMRWGCNAYRPGSGQSRPLAFWRKCDVQEYIRTRNLPIAAVYQMGYRRTGCMFCMFGVHAESEPNRFQLMAITHPKHYDYCINTLGCGAVMDYLGVDYRPVNHLFDVDSDPSGFSRADSPAEIQMSGVGEQS